MKPAIRHYAYLLLIGLAFGTNVNAAIWKVGPARTYTLPSQVSGLVADGDVIEIDAAQYVDCASWNANNLTLKGVGGKPHIKNKVCAGKGIWNLNGLNATIENIEFSGATNPDQNGAGIRGVGGGFTVRNCYFHNNDNGILASPAGPLTGGQGDVLIEYSEFSQNGFGDGQSHNIYLGNFKTFTLQYCYVHRAKVGHEVKSRAHSNYILYNRISDESSNASRNIDLPNGGNSILIGNIIEQGPDSPQSNIIGYGLEGLSNPAPNNLTLVNNTLVNNRTNGSSFIMVQSGTGVLKVINNIFAGIGTIISGAPATLDSAKNLIKPSISSVGFKNPANYDYELIAASSAINKGINPGVSGSYSLSPISEYVHPYSKRDRVSNGIVDIGSYEFRNITSLSLLKDAGYQSFQNIFPNPFHSSFYLYAAKGAENITVKNMFGQDIVNLKLSGEEYIEIGDKLTPGTYLVFVHYSSGRSEATRIVKVN